MSCINYYEQCREMVGDLMCMIWNDVSVQIVLLICIITSFRKDEVCTLREKDILYINGQDYAVIRITHSLYPDGTKGPLKEGVKEKLALIPSWLYFIILDELLEGKPEKPIFQDRNTDKCLTSTRISKEILLMSLECDMLLLAECYENVLSAFRLEYLRIAGDIVGEPHPSRLYKAVNDNIRRGIMCEDSEESGSCLSDLKKVWKHLFPEDIVLGICEAFNIS